MLTKTRRAKLLDSLPRIQQERLSYIDFRLYFLGELRRQDLIDRFGTGPAGATRDIAQYREIAGSNLELDGSSKVYRSTSAFTPVFDHAPTRVLTALSQGFGEGIGENCEPLVRCEFPISLGLPKMDVLAPITRAIHRGHPIRLKYVSITSGTSRRDIVPIALVDTGVRWHVRAFDRKSREFRDFVFTRMADPVEITDSPVQDAERPANDSQWSRIVELELVPHPNHPRPEVVRMDYEMPEGVLRIKVRAANAGYMLRRWSVDCTVDHCLRGKEYALWLRDPLTLYGVDNAVLAPGYKRPASADTLEARS